MRGEGHWAVLPATVLKTSELWASWLLTSARSDLSRLLFVPKRWPRCEREVNTSKLIFLKKKSGKKAHFSPLMFLKIGLLWWTLLKINSKCLSSKMKVELLFTRSISNRRAFVFLSLYYLPILVRKFFLIEMHLFSNSSRPPYLKKMILYKQ